MIDLAGCSCALRNSLQGALASRGWQRQFCDYTRPAKDLLARLQWPKTVVMVPTLNDGPLMGRCFQQEIFASPQREQPADTDDRRAPAALSDACQYPKAKPRRPLPMQACLQPQETKGPGSGSPGLVTPASPTPICQTPTPPVPRAPLCKIHEQQKKASVTSLQKWSRNQPETFCPPKASAKTAPATRGKILHWPEVNASSCPPPNRSPLGCDLSASGQSRWRQGMEQQLKDQLEQQRQKTGNCDWPPVEKQASPRPAGIFPPCSPWKQPLISTPAAAPVSRESLARLLPLSSGDKQSPPSTNASNALSVAASKSAPSSLMPSTAPSAAAPTSPSPLLATAASNKAEATTDILYPDTKTEVSLLNYQATDIGAENSSRESRAAPTGTENTGPTNTRFMQSQLTPPEFPPVAKVINEELQRSGLRTGLKSENNSPTAAAAVDDEDLAEALKRILDEQARQHGISV